MNKYSTGRPVIEYVVYVRYVRYGLDCTGIVPRYLSHRSILKLDYSNDKKPVKTQGSQL